MSRFRIIPEAHLVLVRKGQLLMSRRFNTGYGDGLYSLVAGHVEAGETFTEAMSREAKEEAGLTVAPQDLNLIHVMHKSAVERLALFFSAERWSGEPRNLEPEKCDDLGWRRLEALPVNTVPYIRQALGHIAAGRLYSEYVEPD